MKENRSISGPNVCCFIVHAIHPYVYDIMQILALPSGLRYRLRYDGQWIENSLKQNIENLTGKKALTIFHDDSTNTLFPLRWATIVTTRQVGRIFYFELMLDGLCQYESDLEARKAQVVGFNNTFSGFHHDLFLEKNGKNVIELCVFMSGIGQHVGTADFNDLANWGNIVDAVAQAQVFEKAEFIKVLDLVDSSGIHINPSQEVYRLKEGNTYILRIFQIIPNPGASRGEPHDVELRSFSSQIEILRSRQRAVGNYDVLTYVLKISGLSSGERTAIELQSIAGSSEKLLMNSIYLPLTVVAPRLLYMVMRIAAIVASLALVFTPIILGTLKWGTILSFIGVVSLILTLVGWNSLLRVIGLSKGKK